MRIVATPSMPRLTSFLAGAYSWPVVPDLKASRKPVSWSPRYVEMIAGGASHAPRRKSLPGEAMDMRMRSPCLLTASTMADMITAKVSGEPDAFVTSSTLSKLTPSGVPIEKLLCLPEPLTPLKGFSLRIPTRPCFCGISSMSCMRVRFSSIWVEAMPKYGAHSYWLGATSRWRVLKGQPILKPSCMISCIQARATWLSGAM
mmetsp:Transcript_31993/g.83718  ORF Transcript_31993/g.83718 Transcript_31993/m.83718 type:complete len:202 (-) Transcript_31993:908-1513(-)